MKRTALAPLLFLLFQAACSEPRVTIPDGKTPPATAGDSTMILPSLGAGKPMLQSGTIQLSGPAAPGSASFIDAQRWAEDRTTAPSFGSGSFTVQVDGTDHAA